MKTHTRTAPGHHPTFDGYPRILATYGDDPQVFELFRAEPGRSLSEHEIRGHVAHLSEGCHWWVAYTTKPQALLGSRPRMNTLGVAGGYLHAPRLALTRSEVSRLADEGRCAPAERYDSSIVHRPVTVQAVQLVNHQLQATA